MSLYAEDSEEIFHYGVKGMKWGVRRSPSQLGSSRSERRKARDKRNREIISARRRSEKQKRDLDLEKIALKRGDKVAKALYKKHKNEYLKSADRKMAKKLTSAEKKVLALTSVLVARNSAKTLAIVAKEIHAHRNNRPNDKTAISNKSFKPKYTKPNRKGVYNITSLK